MLSTNYVQALASQKRARSKCVSPMSLQACLSAAWHSPPKRLEVAREYKDGGGYESGRVPACRRRSASRASGFWQKGRARIAAALRLLSP